MSTLRVNTLQNTSGVEVYTAKAWVNFNGTGTVAIRASGNVSSITDNGNGNYTVNFTSALPDTNFSVVVSPAHDGTTGAIASSSFSSGSAYVTPTTSTVRVSTQNTDTQYVSVVVFR